MNSVPQILYRIIYHPLINPVLLKINKALSRFTRFRLPPSGKLRVRLNTGHFKFRTNQTNTTSQLLYWKGPYHIEYTVIFEDLIKKCNCFYDIGAHAGYYSLVAAAVNSQIKVAAFEPANGPFYYLKENIRINQLQSRVVAQQLALGNTEGTAEFLEVIHSKYKYLKHNLVAVGNLGNYQPNRSMEKKLVKITTLDSFVLSHKDMHPDIIKIDTEGTENQILEGAERTLQNAPIIICETLFNKIEIELEKIMRQYGYEFFNFKAGRLYQVNSIVRTTDDGVHDCFFVHPQKRTLLLPYLD
jgi:FkbM family methyltransferase